MNNPWDSISTPSHEFNVRLVSEKLPLNIYWGKDVKGNYLFIIQFAKEAAPNNSILPELSGIRLTVIHSTDCSRMVLMLNERANWEIFKSLCIDLAYACETITNHVEAVQAIVRRLLKWHELLKRENLHLLSNEEIKGLIGELLFLKDVLAPRFGWQQAVSFWKGPLGAPQDFAVHEVAVEVKAQSGNSKPYVHINSLEQMDAQLPFFYLVVNTLATADPEQEDALSLNSLVDSVKKELSLNDSISLEVFESLIFQVGYSRHDHYDSPLYRSVACRSYYVTEGFPRLVLSNVPQGVIKANYQISIDKCEPFHKQLPFLDQGDRT